MFLLQSRIVSIWDPLDESNENPSQPERVVLIQWVLSHLLSVYSRKLEAMGTDK